MIIELPNGATYNSEERYSFLPAKVYEFVEAAKAQSSGSLEYITYSTAPLNRRLIRHTFLFGKFRLKIEPVYSNETPEAWQQIDTKLIIEYA